MTHEQFKDGLAELGLSYTLAAPLFGYNGIHGRDQVFKMGKGTRPIDNARERLMSAYLAGYRPDDWPVDE